MRMQHILGSCQAEREEGFAWAVYRRSMTAFRAFLDTQLGVGEPYVSTRSQCTAPPLPTENKTAP